MKIIMDNIKSFTMIAGSLAVASGALLYYQTSKEENEEDLIQLKSILEELKAAYIPIYVRSYNMYVNSIRELKEKKNSKEFVQKCIQEQSKPVNLFHSWQWNFQDWPGGVQKVWNFHWRPLRNHH